MTDSHFMAYYTLWLTHTLWHTTLIDWRAIYGIIHFMPDSQIMTYCTLWLKCNAWHSTLYDWLTLYSILHIMTGEQCMAYYTLCLIHILWHATLYDWLILYGILHFMTNSHFMAYYTLWLSHTLWHNTLYDWHTLYGILYFITGLHCMAHCTFWLKSNEWQSTHYDWLTLYGTVDFMTEEQCMAYYTLWLTHILWHTALYNWFTLNSILHDWLTLYGILYVMSRSHILELREILAIPNWFQPFQCCCYVCYPGEYLRFETLISYKWAQVLEACDCLKLLSIYFNLCVDVTGVVCHQLGRLGTSLCHWLWRLCRATQLILPVFSSSPAKPSMSLVKRRLVISLPPKLTVPSWSAKASAMILTRNMSKRVGDSRHSCRSPTVVRSQSPMLLLNRTALVALSWRFLFIRIRLALMLYFFMVAQKAVCQNPVEGLLEVYEDTVEVLLVLEIFLKEHS